MPTGYTHAVQDGSVTELSDFAWRCARGMGALIMMRDDPADTPIPERFEPHTSYHDDALSAAKARLVELRSMTAQQVHDAAHSRAVEREKAESEYFIKRDAERARYRAMLDKVRAWTPPTHDHVGFKDFMTEQLESSIKFDCPENDRYYEPPAEPDPDKWHEGEVKKAMRDVAYHSAELAKEIERTEGRNAWVAALRSSLPSPSPTPPEET